MALFESNKSTTRRGVSLTKYLSYMLGRIEAEDWMKVDEVALMDPGYFRNVCKSMAECEECHGMAILHACVRYDPPIDILERIITLYPEALEKKDCMGRTPLHVAAGSGASNRVIRLLITKYQEACDIQDDDGKTPLHFACDATCQLFEGDTHARGPPSLTTVRFLLGGSLKSVTVEDLDETNPVEYAIVSDASMEVVRLLQRAMLRVLKKNCTAIKCEVGARKA